MTEYVPSYWYYDKMKRAEVDSNSDYNKIRNATIEECAVVVRNILMQRLRGKRLSYVELVESIRELKR